MFYNSLGCWAPFLSKNSNSCLILNLNIQILEVEVAILELNDFQILLVSYNFSMNLKTYFRSKFHDLGFNF